MASLLTLAAERQLDHWHSASRDPDHIAAAKRQAASVVEVLRELGYLNELGVAAARAECGALSQESLDRLVKGQRDET